MNTLLAILFVFASVFAVSAQDQSPGDQERMPPERAQASEPVRNAFLPGLATSVLIPFEIEKVYVGGSFHYSLIQGVTQARGSQDFGGYYEWYAEIGFFKEIDSTFNDDIFFTYQMGMNLSFEKFARRSRNALIPYFGAKVGGIYINGVGEGMLLEPVLGLVVIQNAFLNVTYDAGLFLTTADLANYIGARQSLVFNFNL